MDNFKGISNAINIFWGLFQCVFAAALLLIAILWTIQICYTVECADTPLFFSLCNDNNNKSWNVCVWMSTFLADTCKTTYLAIIGWCMFLRWKFSTTMFDMWRYLIGRFNRKIIFTSVLKTQRIEKHRSNIHIFWTICIA